MTVTALRPSCGRCGRTVGILPNGRALPYVLEGDRPVCADRSKCNLARTGRTKEER